MTPIHNLFLYLLRGNNSKERLFNTIMKNKNVIIHFYMYLYLTIPILCLNLHDVRIDQFSNEITFMSCPQFKSHLNTTYITTSSLN